VRIDLLAIYQRALLGAIGGLVSWALVNLVDAWASGLYPRAALEGAVVGMSIGGCGGLWEGAFRDGSARRALLGAAIGAAVGTFGGAAGLAGGTLVGEFLTQLLGELGLVPKALAWGVFGTLVGTAEGLARRSPERILFGMYGGLLGGLIGGSTYAGLFGILHRLGVARESAQAVGGALGLMLLGLFIGGLIGLVEDLARVAWLVFTSGRLEGQTRTLDPYKRVTMIGRAELGDICLLGDPAIAPRHARLVHRDGAFYVEAVEGEVLVAADGPPRPVRSHRLKSGDRISIGIVRARFSTLSETKSAIASAPPPPPPIDKH